jgi:hypothetical protein
MPVFVRLDGKKGGAKAVLHVYDNGKCKLELELDAEVAGRVLSRAVDGSGTVSSELRFDGVSVPIDIIGGRIDSFDDEGKRIGGTGVIEFASIGKRK